MTHGGHGDFVYPEFFLPYDKVLERHLTTRKLTDKFAAALDVGDVNLNSPPHSSPRSIYWSLIQIAVKRRAISLDGLLAALRKNGLGALAADMLTESKRK